jgi:hypothetical protein
VRARYVSEPHPGLLPEVEGTEIRFKLEPFKT